MNVIITGNAGFVGQNLIKSFTQNKIDARSISLRDDKWNQELSFSAEAIIHLAGKAHDTSNTSDASEYFRINTDLTIELFNTFLNSEINDFFYFSSVKAVADTVEGVLLEDVIANPLTPYGQSKWKAEQYMSTQTLPAGKRLFIIRPCMIHGPGNKGNLNLLYKLVEKGIPWPLASFENKRSFISIENVSYLIVCMLKNKTVSSGVYNFADDEPLSTNKLLTLMNQAIGKKPRFLKISKIVIMQIAKIGDFLHLPLNSEKLKKLTESYVVSNDKIKRALKIEKLPITTSDGIIKTINSFKK
jgi:nucleoside-diphosphate-sugar epimerase